VLCILEREDDLLTGLQADFRWDRRRKQDAFGLVVVVCLVLLALLTVVQVAHMHAIDKDADHCPLCIAMQSAAPIAIAATIVVLVRISTPAPILATRAVVRQHWHPKLYTRPPPTDC
jgi:hypothetical protein